MFEFSDCFNIIIKLNIKLFKLCILKKENDISKIINIYIQNTLNGISSFSSSFFEPSTFEPEVNKQMIKYNFKNI